MSAQDLKAALDRVDELDAGTLRTVLRNVIESVYHHAEGGDVAGSVRNDLDGYDLDPLSPAGDEDEPVVGKETVGWTDGRLWWHAGCIEPDEDDVELRGVFRREPVPADERCDTCGRPLLGEVAPSRPAGQTLTAAPTLQRQAARLAKALEADEPYRLLDTVAYGCNFLEGGCRILAEALHRVLGGELCAVYRDDGVIDHVVLRHGGLYLDVDGLHDERQLLASLGGHESTHRVGPFQEDLADESEIPFDAGVAEALAAYLRDRLA